MAQKLTNLELSVLTAIDKSEYGDHLTDEIWSFSLSDHMPKEIPKRSIPGAVSSLVKKGLVVTTDYPEWPAPGNKGVCITEKGAKAYIEAVGEKNVRKIIT